MVRQLTTAGYIELLHVSCYYLKGLLLNYLESNTFGCHVVWNLFFTVTSNYCGIVVPVSFHPHSAYNFDVATQFL